MHELGITETIVAIAVEQAQGATVRRIRLEVGQLTAVMPDAIRFCFDVCAAGTVAQSAQLEIIERPGMGECRCCGQQFPLDVPFGLCDCGSTDVAIAQGQELQITELELEVLCV